MLNVEEKSLSYIVGYLK